MLFTFLDEIFLYCPLEIVAQTVPHITGSLLFYIIVVVYFIRIAVRCVMASIYYRGKTYYIAFYEGSKRVRRSLTVRSGWRLFIR